MNATEGPVAESGWSSMDQLMEHIVRYCHDPVRMVLPELELSSEEILQREGLSADLRDQLELELASLAELLETHVAELENWLFPTVRHLDELVASSELSGELGDGIRLLMDRVAIEHRQIRASLERIGEYIQQRGTDMGGVREELCELLGRIRADLERHDHLETAILFPWIARTLQEQGLTNDGLFW